MTVLRLAINGFGRIGRSVARASLERDDIELVAVNDLTEPAMLAHLLAYDTVHGRLTEGASVDGDVLVVGGRRVRVLKETDPSALPWRELDVDVVIESTGVFTRAADARRHIEAGARKVVISAPSADADRTVVMGVNEDTLDEDARIVSNASCTTNCVAPMAKVLHEAFGIERGLMTTVHAYTNDQRILDLPHKDYRRARAAAQNIIPTSTGAARAIGQVIPELAGRIDGMAMRVPVADGSVTDLTVELAREVTVDEVNAAFRKAAENELRGLLAYTEAPLVSTDIVGTTASCTFDSQLTMVTNREGGGSIVKTVGWYDNETAFSYRLLELTARLGSRR
ncbi:type I glyceraldehyde-3-phosphate dehydrogenase [Streptomyces sp. 7N604]|uniref:type I glyceraldehyde-3-phosphate dehydrogenase n=1 Tax=Streptomyces sp. 7N604 TaxID=3457415 RepID=UPI003FD2574E